MADQSGTGMRSTRPTNSNNRKIYGIRYVEGSFGKFSKVFPVFTKNNQLAIDVVHTKMSDITLIIN